MQKPWLSFRYRRRRTPQQMREFRAAQAERAKRREEKRRMDSGATAEPIRETRVQEIVVRDSHRPRTVIRLECDLTRDDRAWGRRRMWLNGEPFGCRPVGRTSAADMIAWALR